MTLPCRCAGWGSSHRVCVRDDATRRNETRGDATPARPAQRSASTTVCSEVRVVPRLAAAPTAPRMKITYCRSWLRFGLQKDSYDPSDGECCHPAGRCGARAAVDVSSAAAAAARTCCRRRRPARVGGAGDVAVAAP
jgi:hypothetical protein